MRLVRLCGAVACLMLSASMVRAQVQIGSVTDVGTANPGDLTSFTFTAMDSNSAGNIGMVTAAFTYTVSGQNSCFFSFFPSMTHTGTVYLFDDDGVTWSPVVLGQPQSYSNSHCTVYGINPETQQASNYSISGSNLSLTLYISFTSAWAGTLLSIDEQVNDTDGASSGWWQIVGASFYVTASYTPTAPAIGTEQLVGPLPVVANTQQVLQLTALNQDGYQLIDQMDVVITPDNTKSTNACFMVLFPQAAPGQPSTIYVFDDNGVYWYPVQLNSSDSYSNSQCTVSGASNETGINSATLGLNLYVTFLPAFAGISYFDEYVADQSGKVSGWGQMAGASIDICPSGPLAVCSFSIVPSTLISGGTASVTVTLSGQAPSGGALVTLSSSNTSAFPNTACTIAAGQIGNTCVVTAGTVSSSTQVTLTATYGSGSQSQVVTVAPVTQVISISIGTNPPGLGVIVDGEGYSYPPAPAFQWAVGSSHSIGFSTPQYKSGTSSTQYVFANWSDGSLQATRTITVSPSQTTYTAYVTTQYLLTTSVQGGGGTVSPAPSSTWYNAGAVVTISATANSGYQFAGFSGGTLTGTTTPQILTMNGPAKVTATFSPAVRTYTISGYVTAQGVPVSGATLMLTGGQNGTYTTGANGGYSFVSLPQYLTYTVTAAMCGYTFPPMTVDYLSTNQTVNFSPSGTAPTREYIRLGGRVIAIANCGSQ